jgi:hypothetical protein
MMLVTSIQVIFLLETGVVDLIQSSTPDYIDTFKGKPTKATKTLLQYMLITLADIPLSHALSPPVIARKSKEIDFLSNWQQSIQGR